MKTLRSHVCGQWHEASGGFAPLVDPSTEETIAQVSSQGIDFGAVLDYARDVGGPALRAMTIGERGLLLKAMSKALRDHRDELLELSRINTGTTEGDGAFDLDGATGVLSYYAFLSKAHRDQKVLIEGDGLRLAKGEGFWGQHVWVPRRGVAVHINAFNFPAWGFAEKAACSILAGMPIISKPATATSMVAERCVEILVEANILPDGVFQFVCGGTGDLLDRLGPQDAFAFTGSADTAIRLRDRPNLTAANTRVNVEADSLNAAVLGPDVDLESDTFQMFLRDVRREMTQKSGQKCTAVRRVLVPSEKIDAVQEALIAKLAKTTTGNPVDESVRMGPLATAQQVADAEAGVAELQEVAEIVHGTGKRADGAGADAGKGYFFPPTLLRASDSKTAGPVHEREVFGPVATLLPYDGSAEEAAEIVALGGGTLVNSVYSDDQAWLATYLENAACTTGRLYIGSEGSAKDAFGSGIVMPQTVHGGPGRAGGGEELGGWFGVQFYMQRLAVQGDRSLVDALTGIPSEA